MPLKTRSVAAALLAVMGMTPTLASATVNTSPQTATLNVSLTITKSCSISAAALTFPNQGVFTTDVTSSAALTVTCTNTTPYSIALSDGGHASGGSRRLADSGGSNFITYGLFSDSGYSTAWDSSAPVTGTGSGADQTLTVYGKVAAQTPTAVGAYTDSVTVTITY